MNVVKLKSEIIDIETDRKIYPKISYLHRNINNCPLHQNLVFFSYFSLCLFRPCSADSNRNLSNTKPAAIGARANIPDSRDAMLSDSLAIFGKLYCNWRINTTLPIRPIDVHCVTVRIDLLAETYRRSATVIHERRVYLDWFQQPQTMFYRFTSFRLWHLG